MVDIAYSDRFVLDLPKDHKFPMLKYELIKEQLIYEGTISEQNLFDPGLIDKETILLTHKQFYWNKLESLDLTPREVRKIGFPLSRKLINRSRSSANGTLHAAQKALRKGIGMNTAGGTHHAYSDRGEAFCLMNDIGIAGNYLLHNHLVKKILVVDLDVHQGNGTAEIFNDEDRVFTFSMHGADNYPLKKERSDLDISLKYRTDDNLYLTILKRTLGDLIDQVKPEFIFYQAGVDILETDKLGKLAVTKAGCKQRDEIVLEACHKYEIPVAVSMGGGYSTRLADIVDAHCNTFRLAVDMYG